MSRPEPNRVILQSRLNAYNTALGRDMASHLQAWSEPPPASVALNLIDELLSYWEKHHGTPQANAR